MKSLIRYYTTLILWRIIYFTHKFILSIYFWGKKKTVPPIRNPILLKSANELAKEIRERKIKSEEVIQSYINRIKEVNPYINAIVQDRFNEALEEAKEVDKLVLSGKFTTQELRDKKPILGVPFTVKLLLCVKGLECNAGSKLFKGTVATEDAPSVTLLRNAGGIVLATTNIPEFGLALETSNLLYGRTRNPYDTTRITGGSSGGESAILGAGASIIGLGNDMAGSLRFPAHFTGIFSHKPTAGLVPNTGGFPDINPTVMPFVCTGPMCRYSEDLITLMNILANGSNEKLQFNEEANFSGLKIYFATDNGDPTMLTTDREIVKGIHQAVLHFTKNYGATAKKIKIDLLKESSFILPTILHSSDTNSVKLIFPSLDKMKHKSTLSEFLKFLIGKSIFDLSTIIYLMLSKTSYIFDEKNVPRARQLLQQIKEEFDNLLDEKSIFIYPTFPVAAPYIYEGSIQSQNCGFCGVFNLLGLPVTNCPIQMSRNGLPLGIQIISRKNNDNLTMACAAELEKVFGGWMPPGNL